MSTRTIAPGRRSCCIWASSFASRSAANGGAAVGATGADVDEFDDSVGPAEIDVPADGEHAATVTASSTTAAIRAWLTAWTDRIIAFPDLMAPRLLRSLMRASRAARRRNADRAPNCRSRAHAEREHPSRTRAAKAQS